jgi:hypothetical protein
MSANLSSAWTVAAPAADWAKRQPANDKTVVRSRKASSLRKSDQVLEGRNADPTLLIRIAGDFYVEPCKSRICYAPWLCAPADHACGDIYRPVPMVA